MRKARAIARRAWYSLGMQEEDEFDRLYRDSYALPGVFIFWVAIVRGWRATKRFVVARWRSRRPPTEKDEQKLLAKAEQASDL